MPVEPPPSVPIQRRPAPPPPPEPALAERIAHLPAYTRSLLRIKVPVVVTLAVSEQPVSRILDLGPGTLLHFKKPCDEPLTLSVGNCDVAVGEAVKVGEKFGLRITSMVLPEEKFEPLARPKPSGAVKDARA
jgi:flagellar motor switch/type III secretory pathway protein FliN